MIPRLGPVLALAAFLTASHSFLLADDKDNQAAKQRSAAQTKWKRLDLENSAPMIESPNFLLFARIPEARARLLAASLEKQYLTALKPLKYSNADRPWPGKLAIFVFAERKEFVDYLRKVEKKSPMEDTVSEFTFGDEPTLAVGVPKSHASEPEAQARLELATALLRRKMGAGEPPDWVARGFAKATEYRAANPAAKGRNPWKLPNAPLEELWGESLPPATRETYAAYIVDYLAYGPLADQFPNFVGAFRSDENGNMGTADAALKAINLDAATLVIAAKTWARPKPIKPKK